jgi:hypothetical protein
MPRAGGTGIPARSPRSLKHSFRRLGQPVDPRHDDVVDCVRHHQVRPNSYRLTSVKRQLFEEKGIAVALGDDFLGQQLDQAIGAQHRANNIEAVVAGERLQRQLTRVGCADPRRAIPGAITRQHQYPGVWNIFCQEAGELFRDLVNPMQILQHQDKRPSELNLTVIFLNISKAMALADSGLIATATRWHP